MNQTSVLKDINVCHDILILKKSHKIIRRMKRILPEPEIHGYQVWGSSFLIMDYLLKNPPKKKTKLIEVGSGWGILSIFCAEKFKAQVTAVDADEHVFPYLESHALLNDVTIKPLVARYEELGEKELKGQKIMLGGDICFWNSLVTPLYSAIESALAAGVETIIIADPGREPFHKLARKCKKNFNAELIDWEVKEPKSVTGELLIIRQ
ncbi:MAG: class I SAM-dependent methyltransferase [Spongiibacteraceae bacterium]